MIRIFASLLLIVVALNVPAQATLIDRGNGMIYDSALDMTWLQDASAGAGSAFDDGIDSGDGLMQWESALAWTDSLLIGGFDDWRLPSVDVDLDGGVVDCSVADAESCRDNELGYMFYHNLGGVIGQDLTGNHGPFQGIQPVHWSSDAFDSNFVWDFGFDGSGEALVSSGSISGAWAVRSGNSVVAMPGPGTLACAGLSLVLIIWFRVARRRSWPG